MVASNSDAEWDEVVVATHAAWTEESGEPDQDACVAAAAAWLSDGDAADVSLDRVLAGADGAEWAVDALLRAELLGDPDDLDRRPAPAERLFGLDLDVPLDESLLCSEGPGQMTPAGVRRARPGNPEPDCSQSPQRLAGEPCASAPLGGSPRTARRISFADESTAWGSASEILSAPKQLATIEFFESDVERPSSLCFDPDSLDIDLKAADLQPQVRPPPNEEGLVGRPGNPEPRSVSRASFQGEDSLMFSESSRPASRASPLGRAGSADLDEELLRRPGGTDREGRQADRPSNPEPLSPEERSWAQRAPPSPSPDWSPSARLDLLDVELDEGLLRADGPQGSMAHRPSSSASDLLPSRPQNPEPATPGLSSRDCSPAPWEHVDLDARPAPAERVDLDASPAPSAGRAQALFAEPQDSRSGVDTPPIEASGDGRGSKGRPLAPDRRGAEAPAVQLGAARPASCRLPERCPGSAAAASALAAAIRDRDQRIGVLRAHILEVRRQLQERAALAQKLQGQVLEARAEVDHMLPELQQSGALLAQAEARGRLLEAGLTELRLQLPGSNLGSASMAGSRPPSSLSAATVSTYTPWDRRSPAPRAAAFGLPGYRRQFHPATSGHSTGVLRLF